MSLTSAVTNGCQYSWDAMCYSGKAVAGFACATAAKVKTVAVACLDSVAPVNPVTHSRHINLMPKSWEIALGASQYDSLCPIGKMSYKTKTVDTVTRVGKRIAAQSDCPDFPWEFRVLQEDGVVNAFCLPGGKIAITTGLLKRLEKTQVGEKELDDLGFEDKLAAVLGHEITHACASHGAKRIQGALLLMAIGTIASIALGIFLRGRAADQAEKEAKKEQGKLSKSERSAIRYRAENDVSISVSLSQWAFEKLWGLGSGLFQLKHGRDHEFQSDVVGMKYAKKAGYDPRAAIWLQQMFINMKGETRDPGTLDTALKYFSSHPPSRERRKHCEEALQLVQEEKYDQVTA